MSFACYVLCWAVLGFATWHGMYPLRPFGVYSAGVILVAGTFLVLIRSGWNLRCNDPSLTKAQAICSILLCSYTIIYAGPLRGVFIYAYVITLMFAGMQLKFRQLVLLALLPVLFFPFILALAAHYDADRFDWRIAFVHWISLCVIVGFTTVLTGSLSQLRERLKKSNEELKAALAKLTYMAGRDELTALYNRRYLLDVLHREKSRAERCDRSFSVCLIDIDNFRNINDARGHAEGDIVLRGLARLIGSCVRSIDVLGRWDGEEFLLILPEPRAESAEFCIRRIQAELARTAIGGLVPDVRITISTGIAQYSRGMSIDALIDCAEQALCAGRPGRDQTVKAGQRG